MRVSQNVLESVLNAINTNDKYKWQVLLGTQTEAFYVVCTERKTGASEDFVFRRHEFERLPEQPQVTVLDFIVSNLILRHELKGQLA